MKILIGTTGFSYDNWNDPDIFYPSDTRDKLRYYSSQFDMITISGTYDAGHPPTKLYEKWIESVKNNPKFEFLVVAPKIFTSKSSLFDIKKEWEKFWNGYMVQGERRGGCKILHEKGVLGALILQYDSNFECTDRRICKILDTTNFIPTDVKLTFDFLNYSWFKKLEKIFPIFEKKQWAITGSFVENNLVNFGWAGNLPSIRTKSFSRNTSAVIISNFIHISLNGTYGPGLGSYDFDNFLEKFAKQLKSAKVDTIYCSFDNTSPESTFCYPLPSLNISGIKLHPKMEELPPGVNIDRPCCLHDALKFKKLLRQSTYKRDKEGYRILQFT